MSHIVKPKFYIDENFPAPLAGCLQALLRGAEFRSSHDTGSLDGLKDIPLLRHLNQQGYHFLVTQDLKQMTIPDERNAVRNSGISWIGVPHMERRVRGRQLIAAQIAILAPVAAHLIRHIPVQPTAFYLHEARHYDELVRHTETI